MSPQKHRLDGICSQGPGSHNILIYDRIEAFRECYCEAARRVLPSGQILLILTYFDTVDNVKFYLREAGVDVEYHAGTDSLFVIDSVQQFFGSEAATIIKFIELLNKKSRRMGGHGVTAIVDMDAFFHLDDGRNIESYESLIPRGATGRRSLACCAPTTRATLTGSTQVRVAG
jgi:hypothetical protein